MFNRRILISTAAVCALSAAVAGGAPWPLRTTRTAPCPRASWPRAWSRRRPSRRRGSAPTSSPCSSSAPTDARAHRGRLDREYELAGYVRGPAGTTAPAWFDALIARSDALNKTYGLGAYASLQH